MIPPELFERRVDVDPTSPDAAGSQLAAVPDKPAVYLLATAHDEPVLLASGLAVRSILRRRLGEPIEEEGPGQADAEKQEKTQEQAASEGTSSPGMAIPGRLQGDAKLRRSRRADLRPIVRRLYLHPTCSPFETDLWYLWLARRLFPGRYRPMVRRRHCWMIHGDASDRTPRLVVTDRFTPPGGRRVGPISDRASAGRLVELLTALFRLCHHYQVLRQAPAGRACEYKEMGRCSGPCDGTITLEAYRGQVAAALDFAAGAGRTWRADRAAQMHAAAGALDFERAGRIKQQLARAAELDRPHYAWLADAERMDFLIVQPGPRKAELRTFRAFGGRLAVGPALARKSPGDGLAECMRLSPPPPDAPARAEEAGLLADYLFRSQRDRGLFVRLAGQDAAELAEQVAAAFPPPARRTGKREPADRPVAAPDSGPM